MNCDDIIAAKNRMTKVWGSRCDNEEDDKAYATALACLNLAGMLLDVPGTNGRFSSGKWRPHDALRSVCCDSKRPHRLANREGLICDCECLEDVHHIVALHNIWEVGTNWVYGMDMFDQLDAYRRVRR